MLKVAAAPIFILILFLAYTIHNQDVSLREFREFNHEITVYSKVKCSYCTKVKEFLREKKLHFSSVDVTWDEEQRKELIRKTGSRTLPLIFIDNKYVGGCNDLLKLSESGELDKMLQ